MSNKNHLINKNEFTWTPLESGLNGLYENGTYTGITKVSSSYHKHDVEVYTSDKRNLTNTMCSLEDYAIALGLNVYPIDSGNSTSTQKWYTYEIK